jgi:hypothetical protein
MSAWPQVRGGPVIGDLIPRGTAALELNPSLMTVQMNPMSKPETASPTSSDFLL